MVSQRNDRVKLPCLRIIVDAAYVTSHVNKELKDWPGELVIVLE